MERTDAINLLSGLRILIGGSSWATPRLAGKLFGLDAAANPQTPYLARLFGVRDIALGWGLMNTEGQAQRQWLMVGVACDLTDAVAGLAGGRGGYLPKHTAVLVTTTALAAAALGGQALKDG